MEVFDMKKGVVVTMDIMPFVRGSVATNVMDSAIRKTWYGWFLALTTFNDKLQIPFGAYV